MTSNSWEDRTPVWSPDGRRFVEADNFDTDYELVVRHRDGSNPTQITFYGVSDAQPDWQPR